VEGLALTDVALVLPEPIDSLLMCQRYYLMGFERIASAHLSPGPLGGRLMGAPSQQLSMLARVHSRIRQFRGLKAVDESWSVGRYIVSAAGRQTKIVIDAFDNNRIWLQEIVEWSDIYFKANYWPSLTYDPKVTPIVNGNGSLTPRDLEFARSLRGVTKDIDVTFISNVWGGREHNIRLFEALAAVDCRKELLAIFPGGEQDEKTRALAARLRAAGVPTAERAVSREYLWRTLARSRLVMFRSGMHGCMPWRTIDLLCMGACVVFDAVPFPQWPVPLRPGVHYASCDIDRDTTGAPAAAEYAKVSRTIEALLARPDEQARLRLGAAGYYDAHAAPEQVARYVLDTIAARN
jgi:hypothetical protein